MHCAAFATGGNRISLVATHRDIDFEFPPPDRLERCLRTLPIYAVIIVTSDVSEDNVTSLSTVAKFKQLPVIVCGEFTPAFSHLVRVLGSRNPLVILSGYDDVRVGEFVRSQSPAREQLLFRDLIERHVDLLPVKMRFAIDRILRALPTPCAVERFAVASGLSVHRVGEHMRAAGFANTHSVFRASRLMDAAVFSRDSGYHELDLALKSGYQRADAMMRALRSLGIASLSEMASLNTEKKLAKLKASVFRL